jgi:hypothetical protein
LQKGKAPKTDADWENLAEHATQLAAGGALVRVAGTGVNDIMWVRVGHTLDATARG